MIQVSEEKFAAMQKLAEAAIAWARGEERQWSDVHASAFEPKTWLMRGEVQLYEAVKSYEAGER